jgi:methylthioribose-1-phosphate isomerase
VVDKIKRILGKEEEEEIIELTEVVEEESTRGELSEQELKRVREVIEESAKVLEEVKRPLEEEEKEVWEEEVITNQELGEALRKILKAFAQELSKSLAQEIKCVLKEGENKDGVS